MRNHDSATSNSIDYPDHYVNVLAKLHLQQPVMVTDFPLGNVNYKGDTYLSVGFYGGISELSESTDTIADGLTLTLSGISQTQVHTALSEATKGSRVDLAVVAVLPNGTVVGEIIKYSAQIDQASISEDSKGILIAITVVPIVSLRLNNVTGELWSSAEQAKIDPGDKLFDMIPAKDATVRYYFD